MPAVAPVKFVRFTVPEFRYSGVAVFCGFSGTLAKLRSVGGAMPAPEDVLRKIVIRGLSPEVRERIETEVPDGFVKFIQTRARNTDGLNLVNLYKSWFKPLSGYLLQSHIQALMNRMSFNRNFIDCLGIIREVFEMKPDEYALQNGLPVSVISRTPAPIINTFLKSPRFGKSLKETGANFDVWAPDMIMGRNIFFGEFGNIPRLALAGDMTCPAFSLVLGNSHMEKFFGQREAEDARERRAGYCFLNVEAFSPEAVRNKLSRYRHLLGHLCQ